MPDEQPRPAPPQDPFTDTQMGWIATVESFHHARCAGANMAEAAFITAAFVILNARASEGGEGR